MGEELEMSNDGLTVGFCTTLDVQLDSLEFHLYVFVFLPGEICSIEVKRIVSGMSVLRLEFDLQERRRKLDTDVYALDSRRKWVV